MKFVLFFNIPFQESLTLILTYCRQESTAEKAKQQYRYYTAQKYKTCFYISLNNLVQLKCV